MFRLVRRAQGLDVTNEGFGSHLAKMFKSMSQHHSGFYS